MTIIIDVTCRQCGRTFTPSPADIRAGSWRVCPPCRDGPDNGYTLDPWAHDQIAQRSK